MSLSDHNWALAFALYCEQDFSRTFHRHMRDLSLLVEAES